MTARDMHNRMFGVTAAQALRWRGTVHTLKRTKATASWLKALDRVGLAKPPANIAIVLTGKTRRRLDDIGAAGLGMEGKTRFVTIFLDDWPVDEFDAVYRLLSKRMKKLFPMSAKREVLLGYLAQVALHEAGHARQDLKNPDVSVERAEAGAEEFAWRELERLLPAETVFRVLAVFGMAAAKR